MPNRSDSTGTRSSMPWNSEAKSRSAGSRSGENPKQRMPSRSKLLASVPPPMVNGTGRAPSSSALRAATIWSTTGPPHGVSPARAGARPVVLGLRGGTHRVAGRPVERRLAGLVVDEPLALDPLADQRGELALELLLLAVEEAAVDRGACRARDDVGLVSGGEHRGV